MSSLQALNQEDEAPDTLEAEHALIGCVLYDNAAFERVDGVRPEHFLEPLHARLWVQMADDIAKGRLAEPLRLQEVFRSDPAFEEMGGLRFLANLIDAAPPAASAHHYAELVREAGVRRDLKRIAGEVAEAADHDHESTAGDLIEQAEASLYSLAENGQKGGGFVPLSNCLAGAVEMAAEAYSRDGGLTGVATGLIDLDKKLGGLHPSDLLIIAARPSMGKTTLATNIAFHVARSYAYEAQPNGSRKTLNGGVVAFFSLEMSGEQLAMRLIADVAGVSGDRIRKGEIDASEFGRIRDASMEINGAPLFIDATGGLAVGKLAARARRLKRTSGLDLIVVDYLQLLTTGGRSENRVQEVSVITGALKALAKELNVPVIALSQLSRQVENREDKRPQLSDLRESGSIEQDADVVMFIYREAYYKGRAEPREGTPEHLQWQEEMQEVAGVAEVIVGKQRHGPIGTVKLSFNEELTKFGNLARESRFHHASRDGAPRGPRYSYGGQE